MLRLRHRADERPRCASGRAGRRHRDDRTGRVDGHGLWVIPGLYISPHPANPHCSNKQLDGAIKSARRARRLRWTCFTIILIIVIAIAIFLAIYFTIGGGAPHHNNSNNTKTS
jgi:Na+/proline symporter